MCRVLSNTKFASFHTIGIDTEKRVISGQRDQGMEPHNLSFLWSPWLFLPFLVKLLPKGKILRGPTTVPDILNLSINFITLMMTQSLQKSENGACQPIFSSMVNPVTQSRNSLECWIMQQRSQGGDTNYTLSKLSRAQNRVSFFKLFHVSRYVQFQAFVHY